MKGRDSYWDSPEFSRYIDERAAKREAELVAKVRKYYETVTNYHTASPVVPPAAVRRDTDEPKVNASTAAYLADWFAR